MSTCKTLNLKELPIESAQLHQPPLEEIAAVLNEKLKKNFADVNVDVVDCPDLSEQPFNLACKGLGGNPNLVELGGVPYLLPLVNKDKLYELKGMTDVVGCNEVFLIGAGAGPWPFANVNCEMIINMGIKDKKVTNKTRISRIDKKDGSFIQEILPDNESRSALLSNIFVTKGESGKVLKVSCKKRTGEDNFITSIRLALTDRYKKRPVGLGGVFKVSDGKVKQHIMPDFSTSPLDTEEKMNNWLKFYNMSTPLIAVGTLVSADPGLDLRVQHFHSFSDHGEAGHYHIDTTPDTIEYLGYFTTGEKIYRVDKPVETHSLGRD